MQLLDKRIYVIQFSVCYTSRMIDMIGRGKVYKNASESECKTRKYRLLVSSCKVEVDLVS